MTKQLNSRLLLAFLAGLVLLRMVLVSHDSIMPINADSINYATQANYYLTESPFANLPKQTPGIAIVASISRNLGVPYKLYLDLLFIAVTILAAKKLKDISGSNIIVLLGFTAILFSPWFMLRSQIYLSEPLTAVLLLALLISSYPFFFKPRAEWRLVDALRPGVVSIAVVLTRPELPIVVGFWLVVALLSYFSQRSLLVNLRGTTVADSNQPVSHPHPRWHRWSWTLALAPALIAVVGLKTVEQVHKNHYGAQAITCTEAPGFVSLMQALYSIEPEEKIRFAPVTTQSLELACDASPSLNRYREKLLDTQQQPFKYAKQNLNLDGQFGTWLNWHLIGNFPRSIHVSDKAMQAAADEIQQAFDSGDLPKRFAYYPIDPLWKEWLPDLLPATIARISRSFLPGYFDLTVNKSYARNRVVRSSVNYGTFDDGLMRKRGAGSFPTVRVSGVASQTRFRRVQLVSTNKSNDKIHQTVWISKHQDRWRFEVNAELREPFERDEQFQIDLIPSNNSGMERVRVPVGAEDCFKMYDFSTAKNPKLDQWQISSIVSNPKLKRQYAQKTLTKFYNRIWLGICVLIVLVGRKNHKLLSPIVCFATAGLLLVVGRATFYALVEVWLNWGEWRYVQPNNVVAIFVAILISLAIGMAIGKLLPPVNKEPSSAT